MEKSQNLNEIEQKLVEDVIYRISSQEDFNINNTDETGTSLLHVACQLGMVELCRTLIINNAMVNIIDECGRSPLMTASFYGHLVIVKYLLANGGCLTQVDIYVMHAVFSGNVDIFKEIILQEPAMLGGAEDTFLGRMTPLALAASLGKTDIVKYIISQKQDFVNITVSKSGMSPLMLAICGAHTDVIDVLLKNGANLHEESNYEMSSVGYARTLSFPLRKLNIPTLVMPEKEDYDLSQRKRSRHPLTPNLYISPIKKISSPKQCFDWIKMSMKPKRSRSLDNRKKEDLKADSEDDNVLESIFRLAKIDQYFSLFEEHEINFKTFLSLDDEDLISIGISKPSIRLKLLNLIDHYKKIFNSK